MTPTLFIFFTIIICFFYTPNTILIHLRKNWKKENDVPMVPKGAWKLINFLIDQNVLSQTTLYRFSWGLRRKDQIECFLDHQTDQILAASFKRFANWESIAEALWWEKCKNYHKIIFFKIKIDKINQFFSAFRFEARNWQQMGTFDRSIPIRNWCSERRVGIWVQRRALWRHAWIL